MANLWEDDAHMVQASSAWSSVLGMCSVLAMLLVAPLAPCGVGRNGAAGFFSVVVSLLRCNGLWWVTRWVCLPAVCPYVGVQGHGIAQGHGDVVALALIGQVHTLPSKIGVGHGVLFVYCIQPQGGCLRRGLGQPHPAQHFMCSLAGLRVLSMARCNF